MPLRSRSDTEKLMKNMAYKTCLLAAIFVLLFCAEAMAGEAGNWRPTYDFIMRWVNFAIIALLFAKYGWKPLKGWLIGQGDEVEAQLKAMELKKQAIMDKMAETKEQIKKRSDRLDSLMARAAENARKEKEKMVADAKEEGRHMIEDARRRADYQITEAKKAFRSQLIDEAVKLAAEQLPSALSKEDESRMQSYYLSKALQ